MKEQQIVPQTPLRENKLLPNWEEAYQKRKFKRLNRNSPESSPLKHCLERLKPIFQKR